MLPIQIDTNSPLLLYMQVGNQLIEQIAKGHIQDDEMLPSIRNMAQDIGINIHTVSKSYRELEKKGIIKMENRLKATVIARSNRRLDETQLHHLELSIKNMIMEAYVMGYSKKQIKQYITKVLDQVQ
ncbi:GntR family transcriptional regulator [Lysinibacillus mangiferihumi]|uniref:GntR family transcriptional regulator n=1 Tax=Lysinibacillus mangiferihumi TaxID=1130819 RepID=A0A4U2XZH0_9BACI|nr:GntR family transcriptional regulator [Lysinibacillus mangiferihumi]TKI53390.1 GntR family transcriptional regulator [Lysinibacillus mangiferihumi]